MTKIGFEKTKSGEKGKNKKDPFHFRKTSLFSLNQQEKVKSHLKIVEDRLF